MNGLRALCPCCSAENKIDDAIQVRRLIARFCRSDGPLPRAISNSIFQIIVREILVSRSRFSPSFFLVEFGRALTLPCRAACHSNHANHRIARYKYRRNLPTGSFRAWHVATAVTRRESAIFSDSNFTPLMGSVFGPWSKNIKNSRDDIFKDKASRAR